MNRPRCPYCSEQLTPRQDMRGWFTCSDCPELSRIKKKQTSWSQDTSKQQKRHEWHREGRC